MASTPTPEAPRLPRRAPAATTVGLVRDRLASTGPQAVITWLGAAGVAALLHAAPARAAAWPAAALLLVWATLHLAAPAARAPTPARVLAVAVLARALLVGSPPWLSDDLYRYLFEGLALAGGHNPFVTSPAALAELAPDLAARVNHPSYTSIYPPLALAWFRALAALPPVPAAAQGAAAAADVVTVALLLRAGRPDAAWTWARHPLPIVAAAVGGHLDVVGVPLLLVALTAQPGAAAVAAVLGAGVKLVPATVLPALLRGPSPGAVVAGAAAGTAVVVAAAVPVLDASEGLLSSFRAYAQGWSFNGFAWPVAQALLGEAARPALTGSAAVAVLWTALRTRDPARTALVAGGALVLLAPTVHPWYALWWLAPAVFLGHRGATIAATAPIAGYLVLAAVDETGAWTAEPWWLWWATWPVPLLAGARASMLRRSPAAPSSP